MNDIEPDRITALAAVLAATKTERSRVEPAAELKALTSWEFSYRPCDFVDNPSEGRALGENSTRRGVTQSTPNCVHAEDGQEELDDRTVKTCRVRRAESVSADHLHRSARHRSNWPRRRGSPRSSHLRRSVDGRRSNVRIHRARLDPPLPIQEPRKKCIGRFRRRKDPQYSAGVGPAFYPLLSCYRRRDWR